nr:hemerythrin domain-containing protein [uncultured Sphingomonas sp.]
MAAVNPTVRGALPDTALFLTGAYPRAGRAQRNDLCSTARFWLGNHQYFRDTLVQLDQDMAALDPFTVDTQAFAGDLARKVNRFLGGLSGHHRVEDDHYFPTFRAAEPRLGPGIETLDADHHFIHGAIDDLVGATRRVITEFGGGTPTPGALRGHLRDDYRAELSQFQAALVRHLDDEEDLVIPFLLHRNGAVPLAA